MNRAIRCLYRWTLHRIAHLIGMTLGRVYFWTDDDGVRMVGHRCSTCGTISHAGPMRPEAEEHEETQWLH